MKHLIILTCIYFILKNVKSASIERKDLPNIPVQVDEGKDVKLECFPDKNAIGTWRRINDTVLSNGKTRFRGNTYEIKNVKKEDGGPYFCEIDDESIRNVTLDVKYSPVVVTNRPIIWQALGHDMPIECIIEANPPSTIVWLRNNKKFPLREHYRFGLKKGCFIIFKNSIVLEDIAYQTTRTTLNIMNIEKEQYGTYTCRSSNRLGVGEANSQLKVTSIPVCPPACGPYTTDLYTTERTTKSPK